MVYERLWLRLKSFLKIYSNDELKELLYLSATLHEGSIVMVLTDTGKEFDPTMVPEVDVDMSADVRQIGGLGIFLIRQIMNEVKYESFRHYSI